MNDAIQEFGEKRFVKEKPARVRFGPVRFYPSVRQKCTYDDNILLEDKDARQDVVWNTQPGAIIELPINTHQIAIGYEADFENFSKARDHHQRTQNQNFFALADLNFPTWYINALEQLSETSSRSGTTFTSRIPRIDQSIYPKIGKRWKRLIFEAGYRYFLRSFKRHIDRPLNFRLNEWNGVVYYDLFARLKALVDGQVSQIYYHGTPSRDGTFTQSRIGLEGEVFPNLTVKTRVGMQFRNYGAHARHDFNSWVGAMNLEYLWRENIKLLTSVERVPLEATFANVDFFKRHILRLGYEYEFIPKWTLYQGCKLYRDDYAERATVDVQTGYRRDTHVSVETGLRYKMLEWLEWDLAYEYFMRHSNFKTMEYTDNRFSLSSTIAY